MNGHRYPAEGEFHLQKLQTLVEDPPVVLFTAIKDRGSSKAVKLHIQAMEKDHFNLDDRVS